MLQRKGAWIIPTDRGVAALLAAFHALLLIWIVVQMVLISRIADTL